MIQNQEDFGPTTVRQRHVILDALRGLALMGIALANFPEFGLWTFLSSGEQMAMPTAGVDEIVRFLQYLLVDGKFYTIFSLLFGIGFSLILARHGRRLFVRRMLILVCIGFLHLMFIWSGSGACSPMAAISRFLSRNPLQNRHVATSTSSSGIKRSSISTSRSPLRSHRR